MNQNVNYTAEAIRNGFISSPMFATPTGEAANVVDALDSIALALNNVAEALRELAQKTK